MKPRFSLTVGLLILLFAGGFNLQAASTSQMDSLVSFTNGIMTIEFNLNTGFWDCWLSGEKVIHHAYGAILAAPPESPPSWTETFKPGYTRTFNFHQVSDSVGRGTEAIFRHTNNQGFMDLILRLTIYDGQKLIAAQIELINLTDQDQVVKELHPLETSSDWGGAIYLGSHPTDCVVLENAYISWWTCNLSQVTNGFNSTSHWNNVIYNRASNLGLLNGFLTQKRGENIIRLGYSSANQPLPGQLGFADYLANCRTGRITLAPGDSLISDKLIMSWVDDPLSGLERYAQLCGKSHGVVPWPTIPTGWCSWYYYYYGVSEGNVIANLNFIADSLKPYGMEYVQIDDGFQRALGDWETNAKFPHGHRWLTDQIHNRGLKAGLWLAPFGIGEESPVYQDHPDWLVKDGSGQPIKVCDAWSNPYWGGNIYALDPTHPGAQDWLRSLFHKVTNDWGYDYVKIDFLYYAAGQSQGEANTGSYHYYANVTPIEAYRIGLQAIREGVGADKFILGCGAPVGATYGLVDGMRIGTDIYPTWEQIKACATNTARRYWLHGYIYKNDPDCILVRGSLGEAQAKAWASIVALTGTMALSSDNLPQLSSERVEILRKTLPVYYHKARPIDLLQTLEGPPRIWLSEIEKDFGHWWVAGLVNWNSTGPSQSIDLKLSDLGLAPGTYLGYDFWENRFLGQFSNEVSIDVPPASIRVISLRPKFDHPQILSTDRHILQGAVDLKDVHWDADSLALRGTSQGVAGSEYRIYVHIPKSPGLGFRFLRAEVDVDQFSTRQVSPQVLELKIRFEGNQASWSLYFGPGKLRITHPEDGGSSDRKVRVEGLCDLGIDSIQVSVDGQLVGRATISDGEWLYDWVAPAGGKFLIRATGFEGGDPYFDEVRVNVLTLDGGILVVDETRDGSGNQGSPSDQQVDGFYSRILEGFTFSQWDVETQGLPPLLDLGQYSMVLWHSDDYTDQRIGGVLPALSQYLETGGKLFISGWRPIKGMMGGDYPYTFGPGSFPYDYLHLGRSDDNPVLDFTGAQGLTNYPDISTDSTKIPALWGGRLKFVDTLIPLDEAEPIYTFVSASGDTNFQGVSCGIRYLGDDFKICLLGFPLYFMQEESATQLIQKVLQDMGETGLNPHPTLDAPRTYTLFQNYPNPFNANTAISYQLPAVSGQRSAVSLKIYNLLGQRVRRLVEGAPRSGYYRVEWDGRDDLGKDVSSGVYFCRLKVKGDGLKVTKTRKMILLR